MINAGVELVWVFITQSYWGPLRTKGCLFCHKRGILEMDGHCDWLRSFPLRSCSSVMTCSTAVTPSCSSAWILPVATSVWICWKTIYNGRVKYKVINVNLYHWEERLNNPNACVYKSSRLTFVLIACWRSLFRQNRWFEWCHNLVKILCQAACWQHLHEHVLPSSLTEWRPRAKEVPDTLLLFCSLK